MKTAVTLAAGFLFTVFPILKAETLQLPKDNATFKVTLPAGWRTTTEDDGTVKFAKDENTALVTSISRKTNAHSDEEIKAYLVKSANRTAEMAKLKDVKVGDISQTTNPHKLMMFALEMTGTEPDGTKVILPMTAFSPKPGSYYIISSSLPKLEAYKQHQKEYEAVVNAISALP